jgi:LPXTG-motif cell wall-anchored protein
MVSESVPKSRPYWHVDAKWITGILLLFLLNVTFLIFILVRATAPEQGITLITTMLASSFSYQSGGMDTTVDIEEMRQKIAESPNGEWQPIPGMNITVREEDIAGMTPRETRLWFFRKLAEPIYYDGEQGLANLTTDPEMKEEVTGGLGPLGFISADAHKKLQSAFTIAGVVSLVFLGLLILFSYRFGRLGSPGCVIFLAAIPGLILFSAARGWTQNAGQNPPAGAEETFITRYAQLAADVLPVVVQKALQIYIVLVLLGLGLMLLGLIGGMFFRKRKKNLPANTENEPISPPS